MVTKVDMYKPFLTIAIDSLESIYPIDAKESIYPIDAKESIPIVSPTHRCTIDGCYRRTEEKLCEEHQISTALEYITIHKPIQSPVAASKYHSEPRGLSCVQLYTD